MGKVPPHNPYSGALTYIDDINAKIAIPLNTVGTNIMATTRMPTQDKLEVRSFKMLQRAWMLMHVRLACGLDCLSNGQLHVNH